MKKKIREGFDSYFYRDDEDIHSSRQVKDLFKRELFHPTRDYSRQMKQAMAYTVEKNLHEKEKSKVKDTLKESENANLYGFTYKDTVITDKFGNYWTMDTWVNGLSEPYNSFDDAEASMLQCMEQCGLPTAEDAPDAEDYAYEFTEFASTVVPNYIVGYEPTAVVSNDTDRVHSFAFDFIITDPTLGSAEEARDRILNEIELVEGIQIVGNPNVDPTSWSKEEYGLSESTDKKAKNLNEDESAESKFVDLNDALDLDDDILLVKLPAESTYADKYLIYSISSRGAWIAKGVIVDKKPEDLLSFNPFEDQEEIEAEGYKVFATFTVEGNSYLDPVIFEIAENESFIDLYGDGDNPILGEYFGADVNDYLTKVGASDDDDDALEEELIGKGKYGIEVKDPRDIWVPASANYPKKGKPVEFKKEDEAKNSDVYKALVDRYGKDKVRTYKQSRPEN